MGFDVIGECWIYNQSFWYVQLLSNFSFFVGGSDLDEEDKEDSLDEEA